MVERKNRFFSSDLQTRTMTWAYMYVSVNKHTQTHRFSPRYIKVYAGMQACENVNVFVYVHTQIFSKLRSVQKQWSIKK